MSIIRLFQTSVTENEKTFDYNVDNLSRDTVSQILNGEFLDGVFGVEYFRINKHPTLTLFAPPHHKFKNNLRRSSSAHYINSTQENTFYIQLYQEKSSMFPIEFNYPKSFIETLNTLIPSHIHFKYQLLLVYRQDNWKERILDQYDDYLNGVQSPSDSGLFRKFQRGITEKVDSLLKWEQKHSEIKEVNSKVAENGFRFALRIALIGGDKKERELITNNITFAINEFSYTNNWFAYTKFKFDEISDLFNRRKLDGSSKSSVLTPSELTPFLLTSVSSPILSVEAIQEFNSHIAIEDEHSEKETNNSLIELLPKGEVIEQFDGTELANKFILALKELKKINNKLKYKRSHSGATLIQLTFDLHKNLRFSEIANKNLITDIQAFMGVNGLSIEQGESEGEVDIFIPLKERRIVYLRDQLESDEFIQFKNKSELPVIIGVDTLGRPILKDLAKLRNLLVVGTMGSGKSVEINSLILTLLLSKNPEDVTLHLIDVKQVEFSVFKDFRHVSKVITDANESTQLLKKLIAEMNSRYTLLKDADVRNIVQYNEKFPNKKLNYIVLICDEYAELGMRNEDVHSDVQSLAQLGRASGIIPIIASQFSTVDIIPSKIKNNLATKIAFRLAHSRNYLTVLNNKPPFELLGKGDGVISLEGYHTEHLRFQGCIISEKNESEIIKEIAQRMSDPNYIDTLPEVEEVVDEDLVRVRDIILNTGVCKVGELRGLVKMNINKLNDIMKKLVEDGVLIAPESRSVGYKIHNDYLQNK